MRKPGSGGVGRSDMADELDGKGTRETDKGNQAANGGAVFVACLAVRLEFFATGLIPRRLRPTDASCALCALLVLYPFLSCLNCIPDKEVFDAEV